MIYYTIVDNNGIAVKFKSLAMEHYELCLVKDSGCYQFEKLSYAQSELDNINRIMKNDDYFDVYVSDNVTLPLRVSGVHVEIRFFEI